MIIKSSIIIIIAIILIGLFITGCSKYRFHNKSLEEKAEWVVKKISGELDLTDTQIIRLDKIKSEILAKHQSFSTMKSDVWNEVHSQIKSESIDEQELNELFNSKEAQFKEMRIFMVSKFAEFHAILTPDQRNELSIKMDKIHGKWHH